MSRCSAISANRQQGSGCDTFGVCGKDPEVSALIDLLVHVTKGLGQYAHRARKNGALDDSVNLATAEALSQRLPM